MSLLREVLGWKKVKGGFSLSLECAHRVTRRRKPIRRARCLECTKLPYHGPLFTYLPPAVGQA